MGEAMVRRIGSEAGNMTDVVIIGGGIIGLAAAYKMLMKNPRLHVAVLEKEVGVGRHQSGNNSGVLHAGLYYKPGSLKAKLAVTGIREMTAFCREHRIAHDVCGKLVVATDDAEVTRLKELRSRGEQNGLTGLEWLGPEQMREIEPHVVGVAALRVPEEGIVDYPQVCRVLAEQIAAMGGHVVTGAGVTRLDLLSGTWTIETTKGEFSARVLVNCAGLHSDRVARLAGERPEMQIVPFRGQYFNLRKDRKYLVRNLIYPVPDPRFPFLGVHLTRMIGGGIEAGPNAVLAFAREGYRMSTISPRDMAGYLAFPGIWRFLQRYPRMSWMELRRSFSRELFCAELQRFVPELTVDDLEPGGAGVRAQAMLPNGDLVQDFYFVKGEAALHVLNAPSPGATASLAIGSEIVGRLGEIA